uniref:Uncharacterized protein n=1 Tax=Ascaris lumbricoides TaxID=6252 RepID=A0A0M3HS41_ASCLU
MFVTKQARQGGGRPELPFRMHSFYNDVRRKNQPNKNWLPCDDPTAAACDRKAHHLGAICVFWLIMYFYWDYSF